MKFVVAALYHFFDFPHFEETRTALLDEMKRLSIKGSLLITPEGINGTIAGTRETIDEMLTYLKTNIMHSDFEHKESLCDYQPFQRSKVRLKKETISIGKPVSLEYRGQYVTPQEWNALISDPETLIIDTRNDYEVHLGTFEGAVDPGIRNFKQLPKFVRDLYDPAKHRKIATFCTGGIRCEKFTAWMAQEGFKDVYHLKGGILKYLEEIPESESKWHGECYVFDERIAVGHGLKPSETMAQCRACNHTLTKYDMQLSEYIKDEQCPYCA